VSGERRTYFAGETNGAAGVLKAVGDVALLPVGGPTLGSGHLDAARAVDFLAELDARYAVPVHFGTMGPVGLEPVRPGRFHRPGMELAVHLAWPGLSPAWCGS